MNDDAQIARGARIGRRILNWTQRSWAWKLYEIVFSWPLFVALVAWGIHGVPALQVVALVVGIYNLAHRLWQFVDRATTGAAGPLLERPWLMFDPGSPIAARLKNMSKPERVLAGVFIGKLDAAAFDAVAVEGWWSHAVVPSEGDPEGFVPFAWTRALPELWGHPDLEIAGPFSAEFSHQVLSELAERVLAGKRFAPGELVSGVFENQDVKLKILAGSKDGDGRPLLRVIVPDNACRLERGTLEPAELNVQFDGVVDSSTS